jgi:hypothetical protein
MGSPQYLHKLLAGAGSLSPLLAASRHHAAVLAEVRARLPAELAAALHCATVDAGRLRLGMSSSVWAARVRYLAPRLARELSDLSVGPVASVEAYVVAAPDGRGSLPAQTPAPLSAASRAHLEAVAAATENPRLAAALRALSRS